MVSRMYDSLSSFFLTPIPRPGVEPTLTANVSGAVKSIAPCGRGAKPVADVGGPCDLQGACPRLEPPGGQQLLWARGLSSIFGRIPPQRPFHVGNAFRVRRLRGELALARVGRLAQRLVEILKKSVA